MQYFDVIFKCLVVPFLRSLRSKEAAWSRSGIFVSQYIFSGMQSLSLNILQLIPQPLAQERTPTNQQYSCVHISSDYVLSKTLKKPSIVQKKNDASYKRSAFFTQMKQKKFKMADLENSKWPPQKNLIFQLRQFSIFFHEIFMDWSLGQQN